MDVCKRTVPAFTVVMLALTMFFASGFLNEVSAAVTNGERGTQTVTILGNSADGGGWRNPHFPEYEQFKYSVRIDGSTKACYCAQSGRGWWGGYTYTAKKPSNSYMWNNLSSKKKRLLALVTYYGYNDGKDAPYGNSNDYWAATQVLVWETIEGDISLSTDGTWSKSANRHDNLISGRTYATKNYNWIKSKISAHVKGAAFTNYTLDGAKNDRKVLKYNYKNKRWQLTLKDSRSGNYYKRHSYTTDSLSMSRSGRSYTFSTKTAGNKMAYLVNSLYSNGNTVSSGTSQSLMFFHPSNSGEQGTVFGATDMTKFYAGFRTEAKGVGTIVKKSNDGKVDGFKFKVTNTANGYSKVHTTDKHGKIKLNVYPGTYRVEEQLTAEQIAAGYTKAAPKNIIIKEDKSSNITINNVRTSKELNIIKKSSNNVVKGFNFIITSSDGKVYKRTTDENGNISLNLFPGTYTIVEDLTREQVNAGYIAQTEKQTIKITKDSKNPIPVEFHNTFKTPQEGLRIYKDTTDGGPVVDFRFSIKGIIEDHKELNKTDFLKNAVPKVELGDIKDTHTLGAFEVDETDLAALNKAAAQGNTGPFTVKVTATAKSNAAGEDVVFEMPVTVELAKVSGGVVSVNTKTKEDLHGSLSWQDFTWQGSASEGSYSKDNCYTNKYGQYIDEDLEPGTYKITEILTDEQKARYEQPRSQKITLNDNATESVFFVNEAKTTEVKIKKKSSDENIEGIEFTITGKYAWGEELVPITRETDKDGYLSVELQPGTYTFTETDEEAAKYAPLKPIEVTVTGDETEALEFEAINRPYTIKLVKTEVLENGDNTDTPVEGAVYEVYKKEVFEGVEYDIYIGEYTTDAKGEITIEGVEPDTYYFSEISAPNGYIQKDEPVSVMLSKDDNIAVCKDTNQREYGNLLINKADNQGNPVEDTEFGLYKDAACTDLIESKMTDETGRVRFENLEWGTYYLKEIKAAKGYEKSDEVREIIVGRDGSTEHEFNILNEQKKGIVELTKTDDTEEHFLEGAVFDLFKTDGTLVASDLTTDNTGKLLVKDLDWGAYYFKETKAPAGYALSSELIRFSVNATTGGVKQEISAINEPEMSEVLAIKRIKASDIHYDHGTPTFTFTLEGTTIDGKEKCYKRQAVFTEEFVKENTDADGYVSIEMLFDKLKAGTYSLSEADTIRYELDKITNVSVNGTVKDENVEFILEGNDAGSATFINKKDDWNGLSDTPSVVNVLKSEKKLTAIIAEYVGPEILEGNIPFDADEWLEVTAFYDDGSERTLSKEEYTLYNGDNSAFTRTSKVAGTYTVTVRYTEGGRLRSGTFDYDVEAAKKLTVTLDTSGGSPLAPLTVWKYDSLSDYPASKFETEKTGYIFAGWTPNSSLTGAYDMTALVLSDMTLYAKWDKKHLDELSWNEIKKISDDGNAEEILGECFTDVKEDLADDGMISPENLKCTKSFLYEGSTYHAMIAGFNQDVKADGSAAGISFLVYEQMEIARMNDEAVNANASWAGSDMRNNTMNEIYNKLPPDMRSVIADVQKKSSVNNAGTKQLNITTQDKLWLPSISELYGASGYTDTTNQTGQYSNTDYGYLRSMGSEGSQYSLFKGNVPDGAAFAENILARNYTYWTRSADGSSNTGKFCIVEPRGGANVK